MQEDWVRSSRVASLYVRVWLLVAGVVLASAFVVAQAPRGTAEGTRLEHVLRIIDMHDPTGQEPLMQPFGGLKRRAASIGCKPAADGVPPGVFACTVRLGPCRCQLSLRVTPGPSPVVTLQLIGCPPGQGHAQAQQLLAPFMESLWRLPFAEFTGRPEVEETNADRERIAVHQYGVLSGVYVFVRFGPLPPREAIRLEADTTIRLELPGADMKLGSFTTPAVARDIIACEPPWELRE